MTKLLELEEVTLSYRRNPAVVSDLSVSLERGSFVCLLGPNGAGKSSLLRCAAGLMPPAGGGVYLEGVPVYGPGALSSRKRATIAAVVLTDAIHPGLLKSSDVVLSGRLPYRSLLGGVDEESKRILRESLERVEALHLADRYLSELSDGERQRVLLARALAQQPRLLLLDEPAAFLDPPHQAELFLLLQDLVRSGTVEATLLATHQLPLALDHSDKLWLLSSKGLEEASPSEAEKAVDRAFGHRKVRFNARRRSFEDSM